MVPQGPLLIIFMSSHDTVYWSIQKKCDVLPTNKQDRSKKEHVRQYCRFCCGGRFSISVVLETHCHAVSLRWKVRTASRTHPWPQACKQLNAAIGHMNKITPNQCSLIALARPWLWSYKVRTWLSHVWTVSKNTTKPSVDPWLRAWKTNENCLKLLSVWQDFTQ